MRKRILACPPVDASSFVLAGGIGSAMTLTLHAIDGQVLTLDEADIELVGEMTIAGREATRILLRSGGDLIVRELASSILPLVAGPQVASEFE